MMYDYIVGKSCRKVGLLSKARVSEKVQLGVSRVAGERAHLSRFEQAPRWAASSAQCRSIGCGTNRSAVCCRSPTSRNPNLFACMFTRQPNWKRSPPTVSTFTLAHHRPPTPPNASPPLPRSHRTQSTETTKNIRSSPCRTLLQPKSSWGEAASVPSWILLLPFLSPRAFQNAGSISRLTCYLKLTSRHWNLTRGTTVERRQLCCVIMFWCHQLVKGITAL